MLEVIYPLKQRDLFSGRTFFLALLNKNLEKIKKGSGKNIALLGQKNIGKSTIIKQFISKLKDIQPIYIDFSKISLTPESFSTQFIGNICFWFLKKEHDQYKNFSDITYLLKIADDLKSEQASRIIKDIENELQKIKPDQSFLVKKAFEFPQVLSKNIIICIKEFQKILDLENYENIKDVLALFKDSLASVKYIVTSSEINSVKERLEKIFTIESVSYLPKDEISLLLGKRGVKADVQQIFKLTKGHPLYTINISSEEEFVKQTLCKNNVIYNSCKEILNESLSRARGKTLLVSILKVLASNEALKLSEVARKIYRSPPVTKNLLTRLLLVDLIKFENKTFSFSDPILRYWVDSTYNQNLEFDFDIEKELLKKLVKELEI